MPRRTDLKRLLVIGSGPIVIGQACEFDYSGTQAARALRSLGYEVILVNSNPATIMTDPGVADTTYIEPLHPDVIQGILEKERPDGVLSTMGGQTALNLAMEMQRRGVLDRLGIELLGASAEVIHRAEDRGAFRKVLEREGVAAPRSAIVHDLEEAREAVERVGFPCILRPAFTLGGGGSSRVDAPEQLEARVLAGLRMSPTRQVLLEEVLDGWKEFELEVMIDGAGNGVIVCSIENLDPMGVHTGDSITVAPVQTLTDREYQKMRTAALSVMRAVGLACGGANIQFAVNPRDGAMVCIEMNPRVSRSSALASKATGFPIAKISAMLAVGMTLDEIPNDITRETPACYEPSIDYVVVKLPRFAFEKFPGADPVLGSSMKSVGEAMAMGRTFLEALQKAFRSLERAYEGLDGSHRAAWDRSRAAPGLSWEQMRRLVEPTEGRWFYVKYALEDGHGVERVAEASRLDPWFVDQVKRLVDFERRPRGEEGWLRDGKRLGYSDRALAALSGSSEAAVRAERPPVQYLAVDTCAAEFPARTPYYYSSYEESGDFVPLKGESVLILGSGPNRIGQGIEFDCMCVQAVQALRQTGRHGIMMNSNPETVSTDYDISSRLYFEPLTLEHVLDVVQREKPTGVIVQLGGQTPLKLARRLSEHGVRILGTQPEGIDLTESRERFADIAASLGLLMPPSGQASTPEAAREVAARLGYPLLVRPSYVLSGSRMQIVYDDAGLAECFPQALLAGGGAPVLVDKFLEDAVEIDTDAIADGEDVQIIGVMEHIEEAGIHSGDSACFMPPLSLIPEHYMQIREDLAVLVRRLKIVGCLNVQWALRGNRLYVLEVNPRASRTVPYLTKALGIPFVDIATRVMLGEPLATFGRLERTLPYFAVKTVVHPFKRLVGADAVLGPEMRSTGECLGLDDDLGGAYLRAQMAAGMNLPSSGAVFLSVKAEDKRAIVPVARRFHSLGFDLMATAGTARVLEASRLPVERVRKVQEGSPHVVDLISQGRVGLVINTPSGSEKKLAGAAIRAASVSHDVPLVTTLAGARAMILALERKKDGQGPLLPRSLQEYYVGFEPLPGK